MKKLVALSVTLLLVLGFVVAGCGSGNSASGPGPSYGPGTPTGSAATATSAPSGGGSGPQTSIGMDPTNFAQHTITVKANTPITLDDTVNGGGYHILCVGSGNGGTGPGSCDKSGNGPSKLYGNGLTVQNGSTPTITFPSTGTFHIICTVHPGMFIDVTVQ